MTEQASATTIGDGYVESSGETEESRRTASVQTVLVVPGIPRRQHPIARHRETSPATLQGAYLEQVATAPSAAISKTEFYFSSPAEVGVYGADVGGTSLETPQTLASHREKYAELIALVESWLADDSGYDEAVWPRLRARIEQSRLSDRKRFGE